MICIKNTLLKITRLKRRILQKNTVLLDIAYGGKIGKTGRSGLKMIQIYKFKVFLRPRNQALEFTIKKNTIRTDPSKNL